MNLKWNLRSECEPDPKKDSYILVIGSCGKPHVAYYDYGDWNHTECCHDSGRHSPGMTIDFDRWISFRNQPERLSDLESEKTMRQSEPSNERDGDRQK